MSTRNVLHSNIRHSAECNCMQAGKPSQDASYQPPRSTQPGHPPVGAICISENWESKQAHHVMQ